MDEKKEPKYLDLSASCDISLTEVLQRFFMPAQAEPPETKKQEAQDEHHG